MAIYKSKSAIIAEFNYHAWNYIQIFVIHLSVYLLTKFFLGTI